MSWRRRLDDAVGEFTAGRLSAGTLARVEADIALQVAAAERRARAELVPLELDLPAADAVGAWWDRLTGEQRREVVAVLDRRCGRQTRPEGPPPFPSCRGAARLALEVDAEHQLRPAGYGGPAEPLLQHVVPVHPRATAASRDRQRTRVRPNHVGDACTWRTCGVVTPSTGLMAVPRGRQVHSASPA